MNGIETSTTRESQEKQLKIKQLRQVILELATIQEQLGKVDKVELLKLQTELDELIKKIPAPAVSKETQPANTKSKESEIETLKKNLSVAIGNFITGATNTLDRVRGGKGASALLGTDGVYTLFGTPSELWFAQNYKYEHGSSKSGKDRLLEDIGKMLSMDIAQKIKVELDEYDNWKSLVYKAKKEENYNFDQSSEFEKMSQKVIGELTKIQKSL